MLPVSFQKHVPKNSSSCSRIQATLKQLVLFHSTNNKNNKKQKYQEISCIFLLTIYPLYVVLIPLTIKVSKLFIITLYSTLKVLQHSLSFFLHITLVFSIHLNNATLISFEKEMNATYYRSVMCDHCKVTACVFWILPFSLSMKQNYRLLTIYTLLSYIYYLHTNHHYHGHTRAMYIISKSLYEILCNRITRIINEFDNSTKEKATQNIDIPLIEINISQLYSTCEQF